MTSDEQIKSLLERIDTLEKRLHSVECNVFKTQALSSAIRELIEKWPGPFTARQIRDMLYWQHPELKPMEERHSIESKFSRFEKQGLIVCTFRAAGPHPSIYEAVKNASVQSRKGAAVNSKHDYESGFRALVRTALDELPERFTLVDLKKWVAENKPGTQIPEGSWSSTLYKLVQLGELTVTKYPHRGKTLKEYTRGEKRVAPSGDALRELETAWTDFRASLGIQPPPEILPGLKRENAL